MNRETEHLKTLSDRILHILELTGTRKADLARAINVKPQVIQFLCSSNTRASRFTFEIATALGLNTRWLATGEGCIFAADDPKHQFLKSYKEVPLLTSEQVLGLAKEQTLDHIETTEWLASKTTEENVFAIIMPDQSMEPLIPAGATIFVTLHYNMLPSTDDTLLLYVKQFNAVIIRKFLSEKNTSYLLPTNNNYKKSEFSEDINIIGLVTDCTFSLRN